MNNPNGPNNMSTHINFFDITKLIQNLSYLSPILIVTPILSLSAIFQNPNGLIYLAYLLAMCFLRNYMYQVSGAGSNPLENLNCGDITFSKYGNPTFSAFVFAFTIMYISLPMFASGYPNLWLFIGMILYFLIDIVIKTYNKCITNSADLILNILLGAFSASIIITLMYWGGSSKFLLFNEIQSSAETCSMPSKQTFKCALYKNGELISGSAT
jgi:hypothetical protein